jgi:hypothetical protein
MPLAPTILHAHRRGDQRLQSSFRATRLPVWLTSTPPVSAGRCSVYTGTCGDGLHWIVLAEGKVSLLAVSDDLGILRSDAMDRNSSLPMTHVGRKEAQSWLQQTHSLRPIQEPLTGSVALRSTATSSAPGVRRGPHSSTRPKHVDACVRNWGQLGRRQLWTACGLSGRKYGSKEERARIDSAAYSSFALIRATRDTRSTTATQLFL